jgi:hypothetical protein
MRPDPAGLTVINRLRRTEAMVSSALHFGTTKHLEPHQDQYIALTKKALRDKKEAEDTHYSGNPDIFNELEALKNKLWTKTTDADNIASNVQNLIEASAQLAALREPALRTFIVIDGTLRKRGVAAQIPLADVVADSAAGEVKILGAVLRPASSGVGSSTLKRYAIAASTGRAVQQSNAGSIQRSNRQDGGDRLAPDIAALRAIRSVLGDLSGKTSGELDGVLYSRNAGNPQTAQSTAEVEKITTGITFRWAHAPEVVVVYDMLAERQDAVKLFRKCICGAPLQADTPTLRLSKALMMSKKYRFVGGMPCLVGVVGMLVLLSGCAVQVVSSSPRTVVIQGGSAQTAEAQQAANAECAQYKLFARLSSKPTPNQFIYDCVN